MTDLLARLARRPQNPHALNAPMYSTDYEYNRARLLSAEFDRDLALDALAEWIAAIDAAEEGMDDYALLLTIHEKQQQARTVLRELRGATSGEGAGHADKA